MNQPPNSLCYTCDHLKKVEFKIESLREYPSGEVKYICKIFLQTVEVNNAYSKVIDCDEWKRKEV